MPTTPNSIQIRIEHFRREHPSSNENEERAIFWKPFFNQRRIDEEYLTTEQLEYKVYAEFGPALKRHLVRHIEHELAAIEKRMRSQEQEDVSTPIHLSPTETRDYEVLQRKRRLAETVIIGTKIESYSSLNLSLLIGGVEQVAKIFDGNFDLFRVFLDAYIPIAFADVYYEGFAGEMRYSVKVPQSMEEMFTISPPMSRNNAIGPTKEETIAPSTSSSLRPLNKAQWAWQLANYSLLVPFLITVIVMYYAIGLINSSHNAQAEAMKPILEHQLNLLKEDRERFGRASELEQIMMRQIKENPSEVKTTGGTIATSESPKSKVP